MSSFCCISLTFLIFLTTWGTYLLLLILCANYTIVVQVMRLLTNMTWICVRRENISRLKTVYRIPVILHVYCIRPLLYWAVHRYVEKRYVPYLAFSLLTPSALRCLFSFEAYWNVKFGQLGPLDLAYKCLDLDCEGTL